MSRILASLPKGLVVKVALNMAVPYVFFNQTATNEILLTGGLEVKLLRTLQEKYGFVYHLERPADREWGRHVKGRWTGLIGMTNREEVDIAVGCISLTYSRSQACDFTSVYDMDHAAIVTRLPQDKSKDYAVIMPFTLEVWLAILLTLFGNIFVLYFVMKVQTTWIPAALADLSRTFWFFFGHLCSEGGQMKWYHNSLTRFLVGMYLMFILIIQSSYSGTVMSFLTFPGKEKPIRTLEDLAEVVNRKGFKCGCIPGTSIDETLKSLEGDLSVISKVIFDDPSGRVSSISEAFKRVLRGKYAFIGSEVALEYSTYKLEIFDIYISNEARGFDLLAMAVRRNFPYKQHFNYVVRRAFETGLFQKWKRDEIPSIPGGLSLESEISPLSIKELKGIIIFSCYGYALATVVLVAELLRKRHLTHRRK